MLKTILIDSRRKTIFNIGGIENRNHFIFYKIHSNMNFIKIKVRIFFTFCDCRLCEQYYNKMLYLALLY